MGNFWLRIFGSKEYFKKFGINVSSGRAICHICNKKLDGKIYQLSDDSHYFCKKHAIAVAENPNVLGEIDKPISKSKVKPINIPKIKHQNSPVVVKPNQRKKFKGICEYCKKKIKSFDVFYCRYCEKYHCPDHGIAETHKCKSPKKPKGFTGSPIRYSSK